MKSLTVPPMPTHTDDDRILLCALRDREQSDGTVLLGGGDPRFIQQYLILVERGNNSAGNRYRFNIRARALLDQPQVALIELRKGPYRAAHQGLRMRRRWDDMQGA